MLWSVEVKVVIGVDGAHVVGGGGTQGDVVGGDVVGRADGRGQVGGRGGGLREGGRCGVVGHGLRGEGLGGRRRDVGHVVRCYDSCWGSVSIGDCNSRPSIGPRTMLLLHPTIPIKHILRDGHPNPTSTIPPNHTPPKLPSRRLRRPRRHPIRRIVASIGFPRNRQIFSVHLNKILIWSRTCFVIV